MATRELRYTARAGLLPELSRQTYDAFYKALREVVLNSLDAEASTVMLDFSDVAGSGEIVVSDDGVGMSLEDLEGSFMSLGGSAKFGSPMKFGRIGIGSLALLHYGDAALIETKTSGSDVVTCAELRHPWTLDRDARSQRLDELLAGSVSQVKYVGDQRDHFTNIRLSGVGESVVAECCDVSRFYALVDRLRRVLPLQWPDGELRRALHEQDANIWHLLAEHVSEFAGDVTVNSVWGPLAPLQRRVFGEEAHEQWDGRPRLLHKEISVPHSERAIGVIAYFLSQTHASPAWSGLTARVQNVAVEERTFFDVESDPGFRKYLTGEVFLLGDVDRAHLINIDRASFNRECPDYRVAQRFLSDEVVSFKAERIQSPRRAKVTAKRGAESVRAVMIAARRACDAATQWCQENGIKSVPASRVRLPKGLTDLTIRDFFDEGQAVVISTNEAGVGDELTVGLDQDGETPSVALGSWLVNPYVKIATQTYRLRLVEARSLQPVVIRIRPREVVVNLAHPALAGRSPAGVQLSLILELAFLLAPGARAEDLYDQALELSALA